MKKELYWEGMFFWVITTLLKHISPVLREALILSLKDLSLRATETKSPWDDMLVRVLIVLFDGDY